MRKCLELNNHQTSTFSSVLTPSINGKQMVAVISEYKINGSVRMWPEALVHRMPPYGATIAQWYALEWKKTAWIHLTGALLKDLKIHIDLWLSSRVYDMHVLISPGLCP